MIKCDISLNIIEKNGFASEKNLVLKDFYATLSQLVKFRKGILQKITKEIFALIYEHMKNCQVCDLKQN